MLSIERAMVMPISFILQQQDREEVPVPEAEHSHRGGSHAFTILYSYQLYQLPTNFD